LNAIIAAGYAAKPARSFDHALLECARVRFVERCSPEIKTNTRISDFGSVVDCKSL